MENPVLRVVMYHYVREAARNAFPRLNSLALDRFREQVSELKQQCEMATLESAMGFMSGTYRPQRDLCLLTFDDGLKEHHHEVMPVLNEAKVQGLFFVITGCQENHRVAPVHMNHFLTARLGFDRYSELFVARLGSDAAPVSAEVAAATYPWDTAEVASFKYLFNFALDATVRDQIVHELFVEYLGSEEGFSKDLYFSWDEGREMQRAGMALGGHTMKHRPLSRMADAELDTDLRSCEGLLKRNLDAQELWPFCYPYGKKDSFDERATGLLRELNYCCGFSTEAGNNAPGTDLWAIRRVDCNRVGTMSESKGN